MMLINSEVGAVFLDTVLEALRGLAYLPLPSDHFSAHDDFGEAFIVHAPDVAGVH